MAASAARPRARPAGTTEHGRVPPGVPDPVVALAPNLTRLPDGPAWAPLLLLVLVLFGLSNRQEVALHLWPFDLALGVPLRSRAGLRRAVLPVRRAGRLVGEPAAPPPRRAERQRPEMERVGRAPCRRPARRPVPPGRPRGDAALGGLNRACRPPRRRGRLIPAIDTADPAAGRGAGRAAGAASAALLKLGLELFCAEGPAGGAARWRRRAPVFLDLKLHDIPNTVAGAVRLAGAAAAGDADRPCRRRRRP